MNMNKSLRLSLATGLLLFGLDLPISAHAGPIDWLREAGHSIAHPEHRHTRHSERAKAHATESPTSPDSPIRSASNVTAAAGQQSAPSAETAPSRPAQPETRSQESPSSTAQPASNQTSSPAADVPYGVPVPDKPGFVMSPYAPNGGYVDVRGLPKGIQVKDPYTGKIFLTP